MRRALLCLLATTLCALIGAPAASAAERPWETIVQDDARLIHARSPEALADDISRLRSLGVSRVRLTANWIDIAPEGFQKSRPNFDAENPDAYPTFAWMNLDRAVRAAHAGGLDVMIDIGFFAPIWASDDPAGSKRGVLRVDVEEARKFAVAVARRYDGTRTDRIAGLPVDRVSVFTLWNEPNGAGFVQPQVQNGKALSADWYRNFVYAAYPSIKTAQPDSTVLIGGLQPGGDDTGKGRRSVPPREFMQRLACVDGKYRPLPKSAGCDYRGPVPGDGLAHHPYHLHWKPSTSIAKQHPGWATIAGLARFTKVVDKVAATGRLSAPAASKVWLTEFGYETNDRVANKRWTPYQQALFLGWAERIAYTNKRVIAWPQFLLRDIETDAAVHNAEQGINSRAAGSWQSGLMAEDGTLKLAYTSFPLTLDATSGRRDRRGRTPVFFWVNVRGSRTEQTARIEFSRDNTKTWQTLTTIHGTEFATAPNGVGRTSTTIRRMKNLRVRVSAKNGDGTWRSGLAMTIHD